MCVTPWVRFPSSWNCSNRNSVKYRSNVSGMCCLVCIIICIMYTIQLKLKLQRVVFFVSKPLAALADHRKIHGAVCPGNVLEPKLCKTPNYNVFKIFKRWSMV